MATSLEALAQAQRIAQLEAQAKALVTTNPQFNALIKDFIAPTMTTSETLAKQLGLNSNYDDLLNLAYGAVDEAYGAAKKGYRNTANSFQQSIGTSGYTLLDALRRAQASNLGDGAYSGLNTANALSALLGMSQQHSTDAYNLALQEANIDTQYSADRMAAQNTTLSNYNSLMAQLGALSGDKYATDMQGYIAELTAALQQAALQQQAVESDKDFDIRERELALQAALDAVITGSGSGGSGTGSGSGSGDTGKGTDTSTDKSTAPDKSTDKSTSPDTGTGTTPEPGSGIFRKYIEEHGTELELAAGDGGLSNMQYVAEYMDYVDRYGKASPEMQLYLDRTYTPEEQKMLFDTFLPYATDAYKQAYDSDGQNTVRGEWGIQYDPLPDKYLPDELQRMYTKEKNPLTESGWAKAATDLKQRGTDRHDTSIGPMGLDTDKTATGTDKTKASTGQGAQHSPPIDPSAYTKYVGTDGVSYWFDEDTGRLVYRNPANPAEGIGPLDYYEMVPLVHVDDGLDTPPTQPDFTGLQKFTGGGGGSFVKPSPFSFTGLGDKTDFEDTKPSAPDLSGLGYLIGKTPIEPPPRALTNLWDFMRKAATKPSPSDHTGLQNFTGNLPTKPSPFTFTGIGDNTDLEDTKSSAPDLSGLGYLIGKTPIKSPLPNLGLKPRKTPSSDNVFANAIAKLQNILPTSPTPARHPAVEAKAKAQREQAMSASLATKSAAVQAQAEAQANATREARAKAAYTALTGNPAATQAEAAAKAKARAREQATAAAQAAVAAKGVAKLAASKNITPVSPMRNNTPTRLTY